ncbi:MAG: T9SS type A sorting domain-containing protein, partial [Bacteroidota bacterium]|nr:T9SS type A sorting domain-containing protein [Bacteroidota bacterium]
DTFKLESGYIPGLRRYSGLYTTVSIQLEESWNMVSVPLWVSDYSRAALYPTASSQAFQYSAGYIVSDTLRFGKGYWIKYPVKTPVEFIGTAVSEDTIDVLSRWNIIGTLSYPVLIENVVGVPPVTLTPMFYGYSIDGYYSEDTLKPGKAYWVKANTAGKVVMRVGTLLNKQQSLVNASSKTQQNPKSLLKGFGKIIIQDQKGRERTLYFSSQPTELNLSDYEMPPIPPGVSFDVRFKSQRFVEIAKSDDAESQKFPIRIQGAAGTISINWEVNGDHAALEITKQSGEKVQYELSNGGSIDLKQDEIKQISLILKSTRPTEVPKEFALYQNYPNPFNPMTKIKYDLPKESKVTLKVYNLLGQEVVTLVNEIQDAGFKSVEWNANNIPSGIYFYKFTAGQFTDVKKVLLVR